jgi:serine/threonine-protein kinase
VTRYELLDRIGVGGMAEIFRGKAVAAGGFEKPVAIKRILPHLSQDPRFVELLIAEAKVLSVLRHRNIVQIFDVGLGDDGQYFLVMEFVDGKDLGVVQRALEAQRRRLPFDLALHIGADICEALEHAHAARGPDGKPMMLVHRDVSPSNVLVSRAGEVKLTDFGIAKRAEEVTGHGAVRGKFAYISPEQARNEHLDSRSDVFSVALIVWELVTGQRLFSGLGDLEALRAVRDANVPPPSQVDPSLPAAVDQLLLKALARDPARRFASAAEFGAKLRSLRYSLDETTGDPATELAKIIDGAEPARPTPSRGFENDVSEATVIRIHTADAFSLRDADGAGLLKAREVIDRFDEAETRMSKLTAEQLDQLRSASPRDGIGPRARRDSGDLTTTRPRSTAMRRAFAELDEATVTTPPPMMIGAPDAAQLEDETRLVTRKTPIPERVRPPVTAPADPSRRARPGPTTPQRPQARAAPTSVPPPTPPMAAGPPPMPPQLPMSPPPMPPQLPSRGAPLPPPARSRPGTASPGPLAVDGYPAPHDRPPPPPASWPGGPPLHPRAASPTLPDAFDRPMPAPGPGRPLVAGFGARGPRRVGLLVAGALIMAGLAFAVTRACLGHPANRAAITK